MNMSHRTELGIARRVAAHREPWSADRLREVAALLAEAERVHDGASDFWQGRLADHLGFWRRVPGTACPWARRGRHFVHHSHLQFGVFTCTGCPVRLR